MTNTPKQPKTDREWCLYRAKLSCKVGRDALDGRECGGHDPVIYALYNLLHAVEEIATALNISRLTAPTQ